LSKARWWVVFLLFAGTFINAIDRASLSTAALNMMVDLGIDPGIMGGGLCRESCPPLPGRGLFATGAIDGKG